MSKIIKFDREAKEKLQSGIDKVNKAVSVTMGPFGRNVLIEKEHGQVSSTKDGVTVAKTIVLEDSIENMAATVIKQAAQKTVDAALKELGMIAGQKGIVTHSKKAIAGFKLRQQMPVGVTVTLRGDRMYGFLDRLVHLALPRVRDFQGISPKSFDKNGNYSLGLEEQLMFPEIEYDKIDQIRGMDICIVTSADSQEEGFALLKEFGLPFKS